MKPETAAGAAAPATHKLIKDFFGQPIRIDLIGCGGTGSQFLSTLARMHLALRSLGHPHGICLTAHDPDTVSEANVGRQLFAPSDVGTNKATVLINRLNMYYGLDWEASPGRYDEYRYDPHIIISCVDSRAARRDIQRRFKKFRTAAYWLDTGNRSTDGQIILGNNLSASDDNFLPTAPTLFPEIVDPSLDRNDGPSCSLAEALDKQDLLINQAVATFGAQLIWSLFRRGEIEHHGFFVNLPNGRVEPLKIGWWTSLPKASVRSLPNKKSRPNKAGNKKRPE